MPESVLTFRDNAGGHYMNSIFFNYAKGVDIEDLAEGEDSYSRFLNGDLTFTNNVVDCGSAVFVTSEGEDLSEYFNANGNTTSSNHGMTWSDTQVDMAGHADWASWTLAMTSGWVIQGELIDISEVTKVNFDIYPNPIVEDYFNISFDKSTSGVYKIFNSLGQLISSDTFEGKDIIVSDLSLSGLYYLQIYSEDSKPHTKLLVKK